MSAPDPDVRLEAWLRAARSAEPIDGARLEAIARSPPRRRRVGVGLVPSAAWVGGLLVIGAWAFGWVGSERVDAVAEARVELRRGLAREVTPTRAAAARGETAALERDGSGAPAGAGLRARPARPRPALSRVAPGARPQAAVEATTTAGGRPQPAVEATSWVDAERPLAEARPAAGEFVRSPPTHATGAAGNPGLGLASGASAGPRVRAALDALADEVASPGMSRLAPRAPALDHAALAAHGERLSPALRLHRAALALEVGDCGAAALDLEAARLAAFELNADADARALVFALGAGVARCPSVALAPPEAGARPDAPDGFLGLGGSRGSGGKADLGSGPSRGP